MNSKIKFFIFLLFSLLLLYGFSCTTSKSKPGTLTGPLPEKPTETTGTVTDTSPKEGMERDEIVDSGKGGGDEELATDKISKDDKKFEDSDAPSKTSSVTGSVEKEKTDTKPGKAAAEPSTSTGGGTPSVSGLKAGFADDNKQFNYFVNFLKEFSYVDHYTADISERIFLKILDKKGNTIPNAKVVISDQKKQTLCQGLSYADGTFLFFPSEYTSVMDFKAEVSFMQSKQTVTFNRTGKREIDVVIDLDKPDEGKIPLDILFIMDTTGSMGEEINRLKTTIEIINLNLSSLSSAPVVRFGMVLYKDRGEERYITQIIPLTDNLNLFQKELNLVTADGGGDYPEDLQAALEDAMKKIAWSKSGIRLSFVVTDAPPHLDYGQTYTYINAAKDAREKGIKIFTVGSGGLDVYGEYILRQISQYTYARYIFLTYGEKGESSGGVAGSVSHHTGANFQTDKLESIIIRFAKEELSAYINKPLDKEDEFYQAVKLSTEKNEETLQKLFDKSVEQLSDYSSIQIPKGTRVSVIPLNGTENIALDAEYFTDQLITSLTNNKTFKMVERKDIQSVLEEMKLQLSGLVNDETAVKVGSFLGAQMLITGKVYLKDTTYEIFLKLLRVETAEVLGVTKAVIAKDLGLSR